MSRPRIVIVGGALSGSALAIHLAAQQRPYELAIVERGDRLGRGPAFGTRDPAHRLNVPAGRMSVHPDRPMDFVEWMRAHVGPVEPAELVRRRDFGDYVAERLQAAMSGVTVHHADAIAADSRGVTLADGTRLAADFVVLATGNQPPAAPGAIPRSLLGTRPVLGDPWRDGVLDQVDVKEDVLLVGAGLTAVDAILSLVERGHAGHVTAVSRRGLLPRTHLRPDDPRNRPITTELAQLPRDVRGLARWVRARAKQCDADGIAWQSVLDSLRPHTTAIWQGLSAEDRATFVRRVRPYWDVLRHRAAPEALAVIAKQVAGGNIDVVGARLVRVVDDGRLAVTMKARGAELVRHYDRIILCTGPETDVRRWNDPLYQQLLRDGHITVDPLGLGMTTDDEGRAVVPGGASSSFLYTLGSLRRARLWESIAVPELVRQAEALARRLTTPG